MWMKFGGLERDIYGVEIDARSFSFWTKFFFRIKRKKAEFVVLLHWMHAKYAPVLAFSAPVKLLGSGSQAVIWGSCSAEAHDNDSTTADETVCSPNTSFAVGSW